MYPLPLKWCGFIASRALRFYNGSAKSHAASIGSSGNQITQVEDRSGAIAVQVSITKISKEAESATVSPAET